MNDEQYEKGLEVRRAVMGDSYVDKALNSATDFTQPLQDLVTANCWGEVWVRDTISRQTRSLITIATLAALKAPTELKGHVRQKIWPSILEQQHNALLVFLPPALAKTA
ncbi:carboxymuconolactone decarboxylase family protein [Shewanella baltica]|uniref:carboxymuconolactone decarboxylase family protein n=1 Tax=Shewanella baltica TaxID=62322 RepID=UPI00217E674D|nr:carboxymuconolactone decarboxylase family protein [Shewanella baltica]